VRFSQRAFCFSQLHAARLREEGLRGEVTVLSGEYREPEPPATAPEPAGPAGPAVVAPEPVVVFAGRQIPEKRAPAVVPAVMLAAQRIPGLRGVVFGDGPERGAVLQAIRAAGAEGVVEAPGFVETERVERTLRGALCMLLPSRREGYGLIVVEAATLGVPSIVVREPDNAAVELISEGENGTVAASASAADLAEAIVRVHAAGEPLRRSTAAWYQRNARRLSIENSLDTVVAAYSSGRALPG
jgi:glycosyltransferase involved in cell wall biosynthesis